MIRPAAVLAITGLVLVTGVAWLREGLEHREDDLRPDRSTMLAVDLRATGGRVTEEDATLLWLTCSRGLTREQRAADWQLSGHRLLLTVRPALGEHQQRQLVGCLEDLALDHVRAEVRSVRDVPAAASARPLPQSVPDQAGRVDQPAERGHAGSGSNVLAGA